MSIASDLLRGHTDTIILSILQSGDNYGYEINKTIMSRTDNLLEIKEATLYTAFRRLEESGCILSYWGSEQQGARRRYYTITKLGRAQLQKDRGEWLIARDIFDQLIMNRA